MIFITAGDGARLAVRVQGPAERPAVLLVHSIGCDHRMWDAQAQALDQRFRVIRADVRGHGASDASDGDYALEQLGRDAVAVLDGLGIERAMVCGLSLGGMVAQEVALRAPERLTGLVLANTAARIGSAEAWSKRATVVRTQGLAAIADLAMARFFSDTFRAAAPGTEAAFRDRLLSTSTAGYLGCCAALRDADLRAEVGEIGTPTLVIGGRLDVSTPPEQMRELAAALQNATYLQLDAAHLSSVERPDDFTAALRGRLESFDE